MSIDVKSIIGDYTRVASSDVKEKDNARISLRERALVVLEKKDPDGDGIADEVILQNLHKNRTAIPETLKFIKRHEIISGTDKKVLLVECQPSHQKFSPALPTETLKIDLDTQSILLQTTGAEKVFSAVKIKVPEKFTAQPKQPE
jgi:hypothetical protein